jgi:hypothetical protein
VTELICEALISRESTTQPGYLQWGVEKADGSFEPIYGIERQQSVEMAHYWLDAAGVCDIAGQHRLGMPEIDEQPTPAVPATSEPPEISRAGTMVATETTDTPAESVNPITEIPMGHWFLGILALVGVCMVGAIWTRNRTKVSDSSPNYSPDTSVFNREQD